MLIVSMPEKIAGGADFAAPPAILPE